MTVLFLLCASSLPAAEGKDPLKEFPQRVKRVTLSNGLRALIVERPGSPTVSFAMYIRTGGMDDEQGKTGLAHMFEHMLFKGTQTVGTRNYSQEAPLLDEIDEVVGKIQAEQSKEKPDPIKIGKLTEQRQALEKKHQALIVEEEYWRIFEQAGGQDMNASTGYDFTNYVVSLPVNAVPLWMTMEADRIARPVLREFYKERSVVLEERIQRIENSPQGKLWEAFNATAFMAHPYGRPIVGWESDISRVSRKDADQFFKKHYDISRLVVGIVGGIKASEIERLLHKHFDPIPSKFRSVESRIPVEPPQEGERRVEVEYDAEPTLLMGFHRPSMHDPDAAAISVMEEVLSSGRTSRLNRSIVEKQRVAVSAWAGSGPGEREPHLVVFGGTPRAPHTTKDLENAFIGEIEKIKKEGPSSEEMQKVKNNLEADMVRDLSSNQGLASQLAYYEALTGDWGYMLTLLDQIRLVTSAQVQDVAKRYLTPENRTVGVLVRKKQ